MTLIDADHGRTGMNHRVTESTEDGRKKGYEPQMDTDERSEDQRRLVFLNFRLLFA